MNDLPDFVKAIVVLLIVLSIGALIYVGMKLREPGDDDDRDW